MRSLQIPADFRSLRSLRCFLASRFASAFRCWALWSAILLLCANMAGAEDVTVKTQLVRNVLGVGEPTQLQIKITGSNAAGDPPQISVDGLEIQYLGPSESTRMRFENGTLSTESTLIYVYRVTPTRDGKFTIPAQNLSVAGRRFSTEPVGLTVQKDPDAAANASASGRQDIVEIVVAKTTGYVGEMIPAEVRLFVDARLPWKTEQGPQILGEGFSLQKLQAPGERTRVRRNGREYEMEIFHTAITPSRAGTLRVGPAEIPYQAQVRQSRPRRFGPFGFDDDDDPFGGFSASAVKEFTAKSAALEIVSKPLPAAGRPADFSGAVGTFHLTVEGSPRQVKIGDPVTLKMQVEGRGNFDRMAAPVLAEPQGWRSYPARASFHGDDEANLSGTKTFEMAVVPETKKTALPVVTFSYFDPVQEKYVSLLSDAAPLQVEGEPPPAPAFSAAPASSGASTSTPPPTPAPAANDLLGQRYDLEPKSASWNPWSARRAFFLAQIFPALAWLVFLIARSRRPMSAAQKKLQETAREKNALAGRLRQESLPALEFYQTAARFLQLEAAQRTQSSADSQDAGTVIAAGHLSGESAELVQEIFETHAATLYAGNTATETKLTAVERERIRALIAQIQRR